MSTEKQIRKQKATWKYFWIDQSFGTEGVTAAIYSFNPKKGTCIWLSVLYEAPQCIITGQQPQKLAATAQIPAHQCSSPSAKVALFLKIILLITWITYRTEQTVSICFIHWINQSAALHFLDAFFFLNTA